MNLLDYIKGIRKGRDANRIEKDALRDAFTYEALEGYDSVKGNHADNISNLQKKIKSKSLQKTRNSSNLFMRVASIAAIIIFGIGGYMVLDFNNTQQSSMSLSAMDSRKSTAIINIFVPDEFYEEYKTVIIKSNETTKKKYLSRSIIPYSIQEKISHEITQYEKEELSRHRNKSVIDVYIPNNDYKRNAIEIAKGNIRSEIITDSSTSSIGIHIPSDDYNKYKIHIEEKK